MIKATHFNLHGVIDRAQALSSYTNSSYLTCARGRTATQWLITVRLTSVLTYLILDT